MFSSVKMNQEMKNEIKTIQENTNLICNQPTLLLQPIKKIQ